MLKHSACRSHSTSDSSHTAWRNCDPTDQRVVWLHDLHPCVKVTPSRCI